MLMASSQSLVQRKYRRYVSTQIGWVEIHAGSSPVTERRAELPLVGDQGAILLSLNQAIRGTAGQQRWSS